MKTFAVLGLMLTSCVEGEVEGEGELVSALAPGGDRCPDAGCGLNSPTIAGNFFHELNTAGVANFEGWVMTGGRTPSGLYNVTVEDGRLVARLRIGTVGSPSVLRGSALVDLVIGLRRGDARWNLKIQAVSRVADYWARPVDGTTPARIESYRFFAIPEGGMFGAYLCRAESEGASDSIPDYHAVLFEGERVDPDTMTVAASSTSWFNIACTGSALAKLQLTGHTRAAQAEGFSTTIDDRTTMLKMLVADYCGTGRPFTVQGHPLYWADDEGTIRPPSVPLSLEARWTETGAACLNTPRLDADGYAGGAFGTQVIDDITAECGARPPPCLPTRTPYHLWSYNPD